MRAWLFLALATTAAADPKLEPKIEPPPPPRVREIAHRLFEEASAAVREGKLDVAIAKYHDLDRLAPHPSINFNLALVYEQEGELVKAVEQYDKYLEKQPDAKIGKHVAELRATPGEVELEARTTFGVKSLWYVDGELVARDSTTIKVPPGRRRFDLVSELGYRWDWENVEPGKAKRSSRSSRISMDADQRADGTVIISHTPEDRWGWFYKIDGSDRNDALGKDVHHDGRYPMKPGKHDILVRDSVCEYSFAFTLKADELVYLYFDRKGFDERELLKNMKPNAPACGQLAVKHSVVRFDAKIPKR
jgi:tetratricopeptide (TPR) repeat protein